MTLPNSVINSQFSPNFRVEYNYDVPIRANTYEQGYNIQINDSQGLVKMGYPIEYARILKYF